MKTCKIKKDGDGKISNVERKHVLHTESWKRKCVCKLQINYTLAGTKCYYLVATEPKETPEDKQNTKPKLHI